MLDVDNCFIYLTPEFIKNSKEKGKLVTIGISSKENRGKGCFLHEEDNPVVQSFFHVKQFI